MALTELVAHAATSRGTEPRTILLACDDYSAISGRVPLWQLYERGRSLGIGVQVSAQSWHGLGATDDERYRIAATADGGIWLMRTPHPEPVSQLAGTRRVIETATKVIGAVWGDEGSSRVQHAWVADPGIARRLAAGQAGYIHAGGCTWIQVARPRPSPLALPAAPAGRPGPVIIPPAASRRGRRTATGPRSRQRAPAAREAAVNPFAALGLDARPDLTDAQVRDAWRAAAAATHPDRPDGGNPLPTPPPAPPGRRCGPRGHGRRPTPTSSPRTIPAGPPPARIPAPGRARLAGAWRMVPARVRHGRPAHPGRPHPGRRRLRR